MKTNIKQSVQIKVLIKKLSSILLLSAAILMSEACQYKPTTEFNLVIQDEIRKNHAQELLTTQTDNNAIIKSFNGDSNFSHYISSYVKSQNRRINAESFTQTLINLSKAQSYDPIFILAVIRTESRFNFNAIGSAGEIGLMQIKPDTAKWICNKKNIAWKGAKALKDPEYNILVGIHYFQYLKNNLKSQSLKYVNAYNMGLTSMKRTPSSTLKKHPYFGKVIENYLAIYSELSEIKIASLN